ncbi:MAG: radical SAM protein [Lachnospiraceae bacterium]|nr:radical SAM protein [Lachnospiraceae bacterium]
MKILLVRPRPHKDTIGLQNLMICEPLELEYIASNIRTHGHKSVIVDMILEKKELTYFVEKYRPQAVGITGYISHVNVIKKYAREIKTYDPAIKVLVGGVHAEVNPQDFESEHIDYIIRANGLRTVTEILDRLERGETMDDLPCLYRREGGKPRKETSFPYLFPDRSKVDRYRSRYYYMFHRNCSLIKTSFGCPYQCAFCFCRQITDGGYFARDLENVIAELKTVKETEIYIVDDDFLVDRERILEFTRLLKENHIKKRYLIYGRADFIAANEDVIRAFQKAGLRAVIVGLESCDSRELKDYRKMTQVAVNEKAVRILQKYDVECYGTFITGIHWKKEDFKALERWIKKLGIVFVNLQPLTPLKGTELYEKYRKDFIIREDEYEKWDLAHLVVKPTYISIRKYYFYTMMLYYKTMVNPTSVLYMIRKYGIKDTVKLSIGACKVNLQYLKKLLLP